MESKVKHTKTSNQTDHTFTVEETLDMISKIQSHTLLWNKQDPQYKDVIRQDHVWQELASEIGVPMILLKEKWQNLRSTFRKNHAKVKSSMQTGANSKDIFVPHWYAYEAMQFLSENLSVGKTIDTVMYRN
ncbi:transcription factor Adf-1-like [Anopheles stephensi]|uniref:transcription factor Adf-1-like n=1 Tax=Anopheles stephensi TaxID=30069 RepID=UPI001658B1AD|nr:transcription factor Adf-1-like [Anopheles stephensi]